MRDPAAIHTTGLGFTLQDAVADHATLSGFPTPGVVGRLARAVDTGIIYRDNASSWQVWVTPGGGGSGFPITFDDGTNTYEVLAASGLLRVQMTDNATGDYFADQRLQVEAGLVVSTMSVSSPAGEALFQLQLSDAAPDALPLLFIVNSVGAQVGVGPGDPNGVWRGNKGSFFLDTDTPGIWQNTDGATAWTAH